jgi:hypothetical protein
MSVQLNDEPDRFSWNLTSPLIFLVKSLYVDCMKWWAGLIFWLNLCMFFLLNLYMLLAFDWLMSCGSLWVNCIAKRSYGTRTPKSNQRHHVSFVGLARYWNSDRYAITLVWFKRFNIHMSCLILCSILFFIHLSVIVYVSKLYLGYLVDDSYIISVSLFFC